MGDRPGAVTRRSFARRAVASAGLIAASSLARPLRAGAQFQGSPSGELLIGLIGPFTGASSQMAAQLQNGAQQACEEANLLKGQYDRAFSIRTYDDNDAIASGLTNAQFAVDDESVVCVIGHLRGRVTEAALQTYARSEVPLIIPVSTYEPLTEQGYTNLLRLTTKDSVEGTLCAQYVVKTFAPKLVIGVTVDGDYGPDVVNGFVRELQRQKVEAKVSVLPVDKPNYAAYAANIAAAKPDVVFLAGTTAELGPILAPLRAAGYAGQLVASQGFFDPATLEKYAADVGGLVASSSMPPLNIAPSVHRLKADYEEKYGPMTPLAAFGYASAQIVIAANQATGAISRNTMLAALKRPNTTYETIVGEFVFTNLGEPQDPNVYFYAVTNGAWKYVRAAHPSGFLIK